MNEFEMRLFYYLPIIGRDKSSLCFQSDSYWIGRNDPKYPTWVWTKKSISKEKLQELKTIIEEHYLEPGENKFTSSKEIYEELSKSFKTNHYFEMGYLECKELKEVPLQEGFMDKPKYSDITTLAKYWKESCEELPTERNISLEDALKEVEEWMKEDNFYVWRSKTGKIVSMASFEIESSTAKISHVFTNREKRGKGYCKSLIHELTKNLLEKGYIPMLYTDYQYPASNRAYKKVGFQEKGMLINYTIEKENV